jgi:MoaA/NifB/PqqE/SkfB family radical SAM enzyme
MCSLYGEHRDTESLDVRPIRRNELSTIEIQSVLEQCARMGTQSMQFTGGEPFLRQDLSDLIGSAKRLGMTVGVISNGSLLTCAKARDIVEAGLDWLFVSIDGPEDVHDSIRRVPGIFARIESNLAALSAYRERTQRNTPMVTIGCTVSALNQSRLHELVPIAARWQVPLIFRPMFFASDDHPRPAPEASSQVKPENWMLVDRLRHVDVDRLAAELALVQRLGREYGTTVSVQMESSPGALRKMFSSDSYFANSKCFYPWHTTRMNPYGDIYNCSLQIKMGNVREQSMGSIWNSPEYIAFRQSLRKQGVFSGCARCCALNPDDVIGRLLPRFSWTASAPTASASAMAPNDELDAAAKASNAASAD